MIMNSSLYRGTVRHRRILPKPNAFTYQQFMFCLDVSAPQKKFSWYKFRRKDYLQQPAVPLEKVARELIQQKSGLQTTGKIFLLTHLSCFGYCFNPISLYFVFKDNSDELDVLLVEVTNTPWGEKHFYVLTNPQRPHADIYQYEFNKELHVSPFMAMNYKYQFNLKLNAQQIMVHMLSYLNDELHFDATLQLAPVPLTKWSQLKTLLRFPLMTFKVSTAIYWQALILWMKGLPVYTHPARKREIL
jgi:DUF1365 family protein